MKVIAKQKGILLQGLLSFLLDMNGKANREDVFTHLLNEKREFGIELCEEDYLRLVETIVSMCVRAEWVKRKGFWKASEHGRLAYTRFSSPEVLFQEMAVQCIFRNGASIPDKNKKSHALGFAILILIPAFCIYSGIASSNQNLIWLALASVFSLLISLLFYNHRTRLIILGRVMLFEYVILSVTLWLNSMFMSTSLSDHFQIYYFVTLGTQGLLVIAVALFPHIFSEVFELINQSKWLIIIPTMVLVVLFGSRGRLGLLYNVYGKDINNILFSIVFEVLICVAVIFVYGGIVSRLENFGYYD